MYLKTRDSANDRSTIDRKIGQTRHPSVAFGEGVQVYNPHVAQDGEPSTEVPG